MKRKSKPVRPGLALAVFVLLAVIGIAVIPIPKAALDFSLFGGSSSVASKTAFRETRWYELVPQGWNPNVEARAIRQGMRDLPDTDPRAVAQLKRLRDLWDNAPTNPAFEGAAVRLPGYVVPLDQSKRGLKEFLLVPYFGACIHSPPPPSNQIIHVRVKRPVSGIHAMDTVWVSGDIHGERTESYRGTSSYLLNAAAVEPYVEPSR